MVANSKIHQILQGGEITLSLTYFCNAIWCKDKLLEIEAYRITIDILTTAVQEKIVPFKKKSQ